MSRRIVPAAERTRLPVRPPARARAVRRRKGGQITEPIAIIGIGCRFPGGANDAESFWRLVSTGVDAVTEIPEDRWSIDAYYHPTPGVPGKTYSRWGGFIQGLEMFEPEFFGISPREASRMDPQQRLLLEVAWEALEDGGQIMERLAGSRTGVFVGISTFDYAQMQSSLEDRRPLDAHSATGGALSIAANRISYFLGARGPSLAVDTACSSSLVAMDLACRSLWSGESDLALAGGVNAIILPLPFIAFCAASMLSPEGKCKAFDAAANGFVRGEGAGIVVLKPLSRAVADGDPIYALITGSAVNQDGRTGGIAVPSEAAQEALLTEAYGKASVDPGALHYVEAHGTGTEVGDPIEAWAVGRVISRGRPKGRPCLLGSVKTNIGHLEAAAGIAGVIKTALALSHRIIPPNLHFRMPNPRIPFDDLRLRVPTAAVPWPDESRPGIAGVNSFGFGGTNAHIVMMEYRDGRGDSLTAGRAATSGARLLPLSARTPEALEGRARSYVDLIAGGRSAVHPALDEIAYTAGARRTHFDHRLALVVGDPGELRDRLDAFLAGERRPGMSSGRRSHGQQPKLAYVFSGQGSQWPGMGRQLLQDEPVFRETIETCDRLLRRYAPWSLLEELGRNESESRLQQTAIAQPALFALQVALAELWKSWGIRPDAVVGHSVGEVAAAHIAGVMDLENAVRVIFHRGRCMDFAAAKGRMLAAALSENEAQEAVSGYQDRVVLAAVNSPFSTVLSGEPHALEEISLALAGKEVTCRFLQVDYAFHSRQMDPLRDGLLESLEGLEDGAPALPMVSTVTGGPVTDRLGRDYWWRNVREKVRFAAAVNWLMRNEYEAFLEIGPHPVLCASVSECFSKEAHKGSALPSLRRREDERAVMLGSLGSLYSVGFPVDWERINSGRRRYVRLPAYPWQRQPYWHESERSRELRLRGKSHPMLERKSDSANPSWEVALDRRMLPYLDDHRVQGQVVTPAAAYIEAALEAGGEVLGPGVRILDQVRFERALFLPDGGEPPSVCLMFQPEDASFAVHSRPSSAHGSWVLHASGYLRAQPDLSPPAKEDLDALRSGLPEEISSESWYAKSEEFEGVRYGPAFRGIRRVWRKDGEILGLIALSNGLESGRLCFHPALLDACFQVLGGAVPTATWSQMAKGALLPVQIHQARFYQRPGREVWSRIVLTHISPRVLEGDVRVYDGDGSLLMRIDGFQCQNVGMRVDNVDVESLFYEMRWHRSEIGEREPAPRSASFLPATRELAGRARGDALSTGRVGGGDVVPSRVETDLDALAAACAYRVLSDLGWRYERGGRFDLASLLEGLHLKKNTCGVLQVLVGLLEKTGCLERTGAGEWVAVGKPPGRDPEEMWRRLLSRYPAFVAELWLIGRSAEWLPSVLRGDRVWSEWLSDTAISWVEHFCQESPSLASHNRAIERVIARVLTGLGPGQSMRILERGAYAGGTAAFLAPGLPADRTDYVLADVPEALYDRVEQKFRRYPFVKLAGPDSQSDSYGENFEPHSFDVVLVREEFMRERGPADGLREVRRLLSSDGLLILETPKKTGGWFALVSEGLRIGTKSGGANHTQTVPMTAEQWRESLQRSGLRDIEQVAWCPQDGASLRSVLLARGPRVARAEAASRKKKQVVPAPETEGRGGMWLIFADQQGVGRKLSELLEGQDDRTVLVLPGDDFKQIDETFFEAPPSDLEGMERLVRLVCERSQGPWRGAVHLWSLDGWPIQEGGLGSLQRAEALGCHSVLRFMQALDLAARRDRGFRLLLATRGLQAVGEHGRPPAVEHSLLAGLGKVAANEFPHLRCKTVDLDAQASPVDAETLLAELLSEDPEEEIAFRHGARWVPRLERAQRPKVRAEDSTASGRRGFRLEIPSPGSVDHVALKETQRRKPGPGQVEIEVAATALNFRDVMKAMGLYPLDGDDYMNLGDECSGRIVACGEGVTNLKIGDAVMALAPASLGSHTVTTADSVVHKPRHLSFEEAATMPVAFLTAYYALVQLGRLRAGERVLIHSATGGVGLAAVQIAEQVGAEVFATAGSAEKRQILSWMGVPHVMDSRSLLFADQVMEATGGRGVDAVLNSLGGRAIAKGLACLAPYGRFLELGKRDIYQDSKLGLWAFRKNLSYFAIDLGGALKERPDSVLSVLHDVFQGIETERFRALPHRVLPISRVAEAFRHMAQARHVGKIVLTMGAQGLEVDALDEPRALFHPDATYLVTGGLGGLGLTVAKWIAENGGRNLVLMGRSGAASDEAGKALRDMEEAGVRVTVAQADVSKEKEVSDVLLEIDRAMPPLRGVFHAAMVLDDGILLQLDPQRLRRVLAPKADGAWILHSLTSHRPLDFFVLFSSVSSLTGTPGQGNYVAANAFLDALAHYRRALGLPAVSINLGHLAGVGYVSRNEKLGESLTSRGVEGIPPAQVTEALGFILRRNPIQIGAMRMDWQRVARSVRGRFPRSLASLITGASAEQAGPEGGSHIRETLQQASAEERKQIAESYIREQVARVLGTSSAKLDVDQPLSELGLDSLMAIELKNRIEHDVVLSLAPGKLAQGPSIRLISEVLLAEFGRDGATSLPVPPVKAEDERHGYEQRDGTRVVHLRGQRTAPPLFCIAAGAGDIDIYKYLVDGLPADLGIYGVRAASWDGSADGRSIEGIAREYAEAICRERPEGPYSLLGYSLGGFIAMAIADFLEGMDKRVDFVGLIECDIKSMDPAVAGDLIIRNLIAETYKLVQGMSSFLNPMENDRLADEASRVARELVAAAEPERAAVIMDWLAPHLDAQHGVPLDEIRAYIASSVAHISLIPRFQPKKIRAPLRVWWAKDRLTDGIESRRRWSEFTAARVEESTVGGTHATILYPPFVSALAEEVAESLRSRRVPEAVKEPSRV